MCGTPQNDELVSAHCVRCHAHKDMRGVQVAVLTNVDAANLSSNGGCREILGPSAF